MKSALILYPHQLFPVEQLPKVDQVFVVEEPLHFGVDQQYPLRMHKQKLILHRAAMRRHTEEVLWPAGLEVEYVPLDDIITTTDILERTRKFEQLYLFDPVDDAITQRLLHARRENPAATPLEFLPSPNFYLKEPEVNQYFGHKQKPAFAEFYQWQRERFNILIGDDYKPEGGEWILETGHQKLPADTTPPSFPAFGNNRFVDEAIQYVSKHFPDNPGSTDFIWPTNHAEAAKWLDDFIENRLEQFGPFQDTIDSKAVWLYHSALASSLNTGLLSPQQVVEGALKHHKRHPVPLPSLEAFIRQVLGWREFVRGLYLTRGGGMRTSNFFKQQRKLTAAWYDGTLGLPPFDDMVKKVRQRAYAHPSERLMIAGNLMLLCEIQPDEVYRWFSELFIDNFDWTTVPNVYGLSQFADGGGMVAKPFITPSNYLFEVSNYERGDWADVWDGLFWRFIDKHRSAFSQNAQMRAMVSRLGQLDPDRRRIIGYRAEDFLKNFTS